MDNERLNDELLEADEGSVEPELPKRNSKQHLIDKIVEISERDNIPLEYSNTRLKRMNKQQLGKLCAGMIETGMRKKLAHTVGAGDDTSEQAIALGALRMLHDVCAVGVEKASDHLLNDYGYTVEGFSANLKEPTVSKSIDMCLEEIARDNTELLEYIQSPYTRLMIAWGGAMAFSCRRQQRTIDAADLGPRAPRSKSALRVRRRRRPEDGKIDTCNAPAQAVKEV